MQPLGPVNALYPTPTTLVGAIVNGKPNFITIAHIGIMTLDHISLGHPQIPLQQRRHQGESRSSASACPRKILWSQRITAAS